MVIGKSLTTMATGIKQILKNQNLAQYVLIGKRSPTTEVKIKGTLAPMTQKFPSEENYCILIVVCKGEPHPSHCMGSGEVLSGDASSLSRMQCPKSQPL